MNSVEFWPNSASVADITYDDSWWTAEHSNVTICFLMGATVAEPMCSHEDGSETSSFMAHGVEPADLKIDGLLSSLWCRRISLEPSCRR